MEEKDKSQEFSEKLEALITKVRRQGIAVGQITVVSAIKGMMDARKETKTTPSKFLSDLAIYCQKTTDQMQKALDSLSKEAIEPNNKDNT